MTETTTRDAPPCRPTVVLTVLCLSQLLLAIDVTIVAVANPSIGKALGFDSSSLQWTITAYALTYGGFLLLGGRVADLFDRRLLFVTGIAGFTIASIVAATSQSPVQLIGARAAQGLCAAAISPCTLSILASTFAEGPGRRRAYGLWAATGSLGGAVGFLIGGLLTSGFGWRSIFLINAPVGGVAVVCALRWLPRHSQLSEPQSLDLPGAVSITIASGSMIFGVSQAESHGWGSGVSWGPVVAGIALAAAFVAIERRAPHPLLAFRVVRRRGSVALLPLVMIAVLSNATVYLTSLFLQDVLGYSAGKSGAAVLGLPVGFGIGVNISAWLVDRLGLRRQAVLGFVMIGVSCAWLARSPDHAALATSVLPGTFGVGMGLGITLVVLITMVTSGVAQRDQGVVAGVYGMSQQLGGAVGLAVLASIAASGGALTAHGQLLRSVADEAHAIRTAFAVGAGLAFATVFAVHFTLPRTIDAPAEPATAHDMALSPMPGEMTIFDS